MAVVWPRWLWHGRLVHLLSALPHLPLTCRLCANTRVPALLCLCPCRGAADDMGQACGHRVPRRRRQPQRAPAPGAAPPAHSVGYAPGTSKPAAAHSCCAMYGTCEVQPAMQTSQDGGMHASRWLCPHGLFYSTVLNKCVDCSPAPVLSMQRRSWRRPSRTSSCCRAARRSSTAKSVRQGDFGQLCGSNT